MIEVYFAKWLCRFTVQDQASVIISALWQVWKLAMMEHVQRNDHMASQEVNKWSPLVNCMSSLLKPHDWIMGAPSQQASPI